MNIRPPFILREKHTEGILKLLQQTTLGTDGARYRHLNTEEIIHDLDDPLFLSLERGEKVIGNISLCRRGTNWYIRYFAFDSLFQSSKASSRETAKGSNEVKKSGLKDTIGAFFDEQSAAGICFYAYIDPKNLRSKFMSENFGFETIARLKTHSFSRSKPKRSQSLIEISDPGRIRTLSQYFKHQLFYTDYQPKANRFYALEKNGETLAFARVRQAHWEIERLPGKMGGLLTKLVPFLPALNRFLVPSNHRFLVPDMVWAKDNKPQLLQELFESLLAAENQRLILWWADEKDPVLQYDKQISWGIFSWFLGNPSVDVVAKFSSENKPDTEKPVFVCGIDLV
ncbi:MAG: hypothetical protein K0R65_1348 [Crocinitomicaceae bacterium]|jgi:hypothetical protein|nr:hypothetical protein [Crocinitomicaceae bacterium]